MELLIFAVAALVVGFYAGIEVFVWFIKHRINKGHTVRFLADLGLTREEDKNAK